ncbi:hypothetical protein PL11201_520017 [Planktothrix sp. PCC 11201]|nr:hypothetical protein PL11201_520017 [Planktothrix sp. PCC 11201]
MLTQVLCSEAFTPQSPKGITTISEEASEPSVSPLPYKLLN